MGREQTWQNNVRVCVAPDCDQRVFRNLCARMGSTALDAANTCSALVWAECFKFKMPLLELLLCRAWKTQLPRDSERVLKNAEKSFISRLTGESYMCHRSHDMNAEIGLLVAPPMYPRQSCAAKPCNIKILRFRSAGLCTVHENISMDLKLGKSSQWVH